MNYTAECVIEAKNYSEAIERFGDYMDAIYGPKWKLTRSNATPYIRTGVGEVTLWSFDMAAEWLGPVHNAGKSPDD